jgi:16S rRNA (guanine966-N2)-methyltransferase
VTRIVAGRAGGRRLAVPPGQDTRPTSDRAREALFSTLSSLLPTLEGARVLDLYAGSGAVGLEALSRGAAHCLLVDSGPAALRALRANVAALGLAGAEVVGQPVERVVGQPARAPAYDLVFLDPPYAVSAAAVGDVLTRLGQGGWLAPAAVVAVERATREGTFGWPAGFVAERSRRYGEATLWYGRAPNSPTSQP